MNADWQRCYEAFLQSIYDRSGSEHSRKNYRSNLSRFFAYCNKSPDEITRSDILAFVQSPSSSKRNHGGEASASTKNQRLCALVSFYRFASSYEVNGEPIFQKAMPTQGLRYLKPAEPYRSMSTDELRRFFAAIPTDSVKGLRDRAIFAMYFWTARRRCEIAAIRWRDIEQAIIVEDNGTRRVGHIYRYKPKGKQRTIKTKELPPRAWQAIEQYLQSSGRLATMQPDDFLFVSVRPGQGRTNGVKNWPLNHHYINQMFKEYCAEAGLDVGRLSLHSLRHCAANERQQAGQHILLIKEILDHEHLDTTFRYLQRVGGVADPGARLLEARYGL